MWFSRRREFRADASAAELAGREPMIAALERLGAGRAMADSLPRSVAAYGIRANARRGVRAWFASHPPLEGTDRGAAAAANAEAREGMPH